MHRSCNKMKDWPTPSLPYKNNRKKKQQTLQTNTQQPGKMKSFGKTLSSSATVLPTLMGNHFAQFLQISFALWERWQCFSSSLQTRKNCGQIFTTANFKAIFPWQPYLKSWSCRTCQLATPKGAISFFKNIADTVLNHWLFSALQQTLSKH